MPEKRAVFSPKIGAVPEVNSSVDQVESGRDEAAVPAPARLSPHTITGVNYGWASRLRSYLFINPLIWFYTVFLGLGSLAGGHRGSQRTPFALVFACLVVADHENDLLAREGDRAR